jgi:hypothetical protein
LSQNGQDHPNEQEPPWSSGGRPGNRLNELQGYFLVRFPWATRPAYFAAMQKNPHGSI